MSDDYQRLLRPLAGKSISLGESNDLIAELANTRMELDAANQPEIEFEPPVDEQLGNARLHELDAALNAEGDDLTDVAPYDVLFGRHSELYDAEYKHWAAWVLWQELDAWKAKTLDRLLSDTDAKQAAAWSEIRAAWELYRAEGSDQFDWDFDSRPLMRDLCARVDGDTPEVSDS